MRNCRDCKKSIFKSGLCQIHYTQKLSRWSDRSRYRKSLGLCARCTQPKVINRNACEYHLKKNAKNAQNFRARQIKLRGWKFVRVKV